MANAAEKLSQHLGKEISCYKDFIPVLQQETDNLINRDYKALYETVARKEGFLVKIASLGRTRIELMEEAAGEAGLSGDDVKLSRIIENTDQPLSDELTELRSKVLSLMESINEISRVNTLVVEGSLENINKTLGLLSNLAANKTYSPKGAFHQMELKGSRLNEGV